MLSRCGSCSMKDSTRVHFCAIFNFKLHKLSKLFEQALAVAKELLYCSIR